MKTNEVLEWIDNREFLDRIYQFAYHRCNTSYEAEDLCSDIILAVISAVQKQERIENFYGFVWTIAGRVYADHCEKRNQERRMISIENEELPIIQKENEIDHLLEDMVIKEQMKRIVSEISFLSKAYRDVTVMYYLDEVRVKDIAMRLGISETTVKQRLFSARNQIRKEVTAMNQRNLSLKPIQLDFIGTGNPIGNDPREKAERSFSQNLIYLCKDKPKSAKELSDALCVPMPYIEEELEIQCRGENGSYGTLRKLDNGKYAINILLADYDEYVQANKIYEKYLPAFCGLIRTNLEKNRERILSFPFLSSQKEVAFILWSLIFRTVWDLNGRINKEISERYFADIKPRERPFFCAAVAFRPDEKMDEFGFYGCDGINAAAVGDYQLVFVSNIYGKRMDPHFHCGHNISQDEKLLLVLRAIGGLPEDELTDTEKEVAAKAIACGYLRKNGKILEPKILVIDQKDEKAFYQLSYDLTKGVEPIVEQIAAELSDFMKQHIPEHLLNEYQIYTTLIAGAHILSQTIEECIREGLLRVPENRLCAEGVYMGVKK